MSQLSLTLEIFVTTCHNLIFYQSFVNVSSDQVLKIVVKYSAKDECLRAFWEENTNGVTPYSLHSQDFPGTLNTVIVVVDLSITHVCLLFTE
jgi:hypothetical protein